MVMFSVFGISSPAFVTGIFLLYVFGVVLGWFPTFGPGRGFVDRLWHLTLPAVALALSVMAIVVKITRAAMIEELDKDYVVFARARGMSRARITFAYVLRNALIPVVTAAGIIVVGLLASAIYVEVTFALPGLGSLIVDAVQKRDIPLIQGTTLVFACFVVLVNLVIDVIYALIDPRIRFTQGGLVSAPGGAVRAERFRHVAAAPGLVIIAVLIMAVVVVCAIFGSGIAPDSPFTQRLAVGDQPPSAEFLAGTDLLGRDVLSRVVHGAWTALVGPIVIAAGAFAIATLLGLLSGYLGGLVDTIIMRWVDFMIALPGPLVAIVVVGVVGGGYWTAVAGADHSLHRARHAHRQKRRSRAAAAPLYRRGAGAWRIEDAHPLRAHSAERAADRPRLRAARFRFCADQPRRPFLPRPWRRAGHARLGPDAFREPHNPVLQPGSAAPAGGDDHSDRGQHEPDR